MSDDPSKPTRPREDAKVVYAFPLKEVPGKTIVGVHASYPPGGWTPPHTHENGSISVYIVSGKVKLQLNYGETTIDCAGQSHYEPPETHVTIAENPSTTETCVFFFTEIIDTKVWEKEGEDALYKIDPEYE
ncbi:hypothetical protein N7499_004052 [Penicillium canescens]|uniref:Cupin type-2 domain-containing protein n=1 Tax=Penicillium canescens TaxID=5083 RepID=A0AAD6NEN4_PENCN|nr:uncharacterized protein N7446_007563 [Penicillium canescens]KAJ5991636.1 hypothetical protein N7522_011843 [Penicillium canescens]KAJ6049110.1 hypothetical protein N7444_005826 [Penicillium canescens]KAJ6052917.1 hypothetical protein N7460_003451 [Penicillium canescens]KAJ6063443.1 hypothetical protein N7446_007563 [Penicillium canescens]KAJ6089205.1 hypothetical protein N7499_004052 [Penicillium canescens]